MRDSTVLHTYIHTEYNELLLPLTIIQAFNRL